MFDRYHAEATGKVADETKALLTVLRDLSAQRARELAALAGDLTRTEAYRRQQGAAIAADFATKADRAVTQSGARTRAEQLLRDAPTPSTSAVAHRGRFTTDGTSEPAWALYWAQALTRWPLGELEALCDEAVATGRLGLADAVRRETAMRLEARRVGGDAKDTAEETVAAACAKTVTAAAKPELLQATAPLDALRTILRLLDAEWRALRAPAAPGMTGTQAIAGAVDPLARLQAHRTAEAERARA